MSDESKTKEGEEELNRAEEEIAEGGPNSAESEAAQAEDFEMIPDDETASPAERVKKIRDDLKRCEAQKQEYLAGWQRAKADLINYKRDESKRFDGFAKYACEDVVAEVAQVLDSFDMALEHEMPKEVERGIILIRSQLEDVLRRKGLSFMQAKGRKFDPSLHEAVGEIESDGEEEIVIEEVQRGYLLNGKVIRPARVKISKKPPG